MCLIVNLVFSHFGFWSGNFFLIAPFPGHCLRVPSFIQSYILFSGIRVLGRVPRIRTASHHLDLNIAG